MYRIEIVLVDDSQLFLEEVVGYLNQNLKRENVTISTYYEPMKALQYILQNKPSIIVLDNIMPEVEGIEMAKIIKSTYNPYLILCSAMQPKLMAEGVFNANIRKPFRFEELLEKINVGFAVREDNARNVLRIMLNGLDCTVKDKAFLEDVMMITVGTKTEDMFYEVLSEKFCKDATVIRKQLTRIVNNTYRNFGFIEKPKNIEYMKKILSIVRDKVNG